MNTLRLLAAVAAALVLAGCATQRAPSPRDPLEPVNRAVFEFNDVADRYAIRPVAEGYRFVLPEPVRTSVRNFYSNLRDPWIALNQLLQGKVELALSDGWRFIVNSTFGIVGLFDVASDMRLPKHNEDLGQTLAVWGIGDGPYVVLPIWGPTTVRDGIGFGVEAYYAYLPYQIPDWLDWRHRVAWSNALTALDFVSLRASLLEASDVFEQAALDRYAFVRDAYFQRRRNLIYDGNPPPQRDPGAAAPVLSPELAREPRSAAAASDGLEAVSDGVGAVMPAAIAPRIPANYQAVLSVSAVGSASPR